MADDAPLLGIEEINRPGAGMRYQDHAMCEGNFIEAGTAWQFEDCDLL